MSKTLSTKYYQENKERLQKKPAKDLKIFLKKKKNSRDKVISVIKIYQNKQKLVEYRKEYYGMRKNALL